jgi:hypothetical protein
MAEKTIRPHSRRHGRALRQQVALERAIIRRADKVSSIRLFATIMRQEKVPGVEASRFTTRRAWRKAVMAHRK